MTNCTGTVPSVIGTSGWDSSRAVIATYKIVFSCDRTHEYLHVLVNDQFAHFIKIYITKCRVSILLQIHKLCYRLPKL
jgi:hypothetical protein